MAVCAGATRYIDPLGLPVRELRRRRAYIAPPRSGWTGRRTSPTTRRSTPAARCPASRVRRRTAIELVKLLATSTEVGSLLRLALDAVRLRPVAGRDADACNQQSVVQRVPESGYNVKQLMLALTQSDGFPLPARPNRRSSMTRFKIDRRTVIKGAGTIAIALPWLEIMANGRRAHAQTSGGAVEAVLDGVSARRGGSPAAPIGDNTRRPARETSFTMSPILMPLEPRTRADSSIVDGLNLDLRRSEQVLRRAAPGRRGGLAHRGDPAGRGQLLPPSRRRSTRCWRPGCRPARPFGSLQLAVRWATGQVARESCTHKRDELPERGTSGPIPPASIRRTSSRSCSAPPPGAPAGWAAPTLPDARRSRFWTTSTRSTHALESEARHRRSRAAGPAPHADSRSRSRGLDDDCHAADADRSCKPPAKVDTTGYNPTSGLNSADDGAIKDIVDRHEDPARSVSS